MFRSKCVTTTLSSQSRAGDNSRDVGKVHKANNLYSLHSDTVESFSLCSCTSC